MYGLSVRVSPCTADGCGGVQAPGGVRYNQAMIFSGCHG